jgi:glucosamine--fructose-6-phosphate aminotransferase (isomerizing)
MLESLLRGLGERPADPEVGHEGRPGHRLPVHRLWLQLLHVASRSGQLATDYGKAGPRHSGFRTASLRGLGSECQHKCQPILVSRSGNSSEIVRAAEYLERERDIRTLAISCGEHQPLDKTASDTLHLLPADEKSVVMTRSFSSMLLGAQILAAQVANRPEVTEGIRRIPDGVQLVLDSVHARIQQFVETNTFVDYVFLAQGPLFGIASEGQLKVKEMSCSFAQVYHTLEFRHGPKAIVGPETLLTFLLSETGYEEERKVLEEMKALGATTLVMANEVDDAARQNADFLLELHLDVPECVRQVGYLVTLQLLGLYTGTKKGYDIDSPRNLTRAVILDND